MNKKKSVLFYLLLSIVMTIGLSGCSKSDGAEVSTDEPEENVVQETSEDKTTE